MLSAVEGNHNPAGKLLPDYLCEVFLQSILNHFCGFVRLSIFQSVVRKHEPNALVMRRKVAEIGIFRVCQEILRGKFFARGWKDRPYSLADGTADRVILKGHACLGGVEDHAVTRESIREQIGSSVAPVFPGEIEISAVIG